MRRISLLFLLVSTFAWADAADFATKLDGIYDKRDDPSAAKDGDAAVSEALTAAPNDYGVLWRAARWKWWVADGSSGDRRKELGKEGWELGDRAIKANPDGVEGNHFAAVAIGAYSQAVGIMKALTQGLEGKFNERLDKAIKLNPGFLHAAPLIAKGRYYWELPWPKRNLGKSADLLGQALQKEPGNLRAYVYLAQTQLKDGDAKKAKETIQKALTGDVSYDPPEGRRAQQMAKQVSAEIDKELK